MHMTTALEQGKQNGKERDQSFGTDAIGRFPGQHQCLLHLRAKEGRTRTGESAWFCRGMMKETQSGFARLPGYLHKRIEEEGFLGS